jgi:hypothetical protein
MSSDVRSSQSFRIRFLFLTFDDLNYFGGFSVVSVKIRDIRHFCECVKKKIWAKGIKTVRIWNLIAFVTRFPSLMCEFERMK